MANNFKPWVDAPTAGQQVQSAEVFASDAQRVEGFKAGDPASALRVNSALRQANVVVAALMQFCDEIEALPADLSLLSTVTQVKNAIKDAVDALHNITLTSAKNYTDTRETAINAKITNVQTQVTGNKNDITALTEQVDEHDAEIAALSGGTSTLTTRVGTLETEFNTHNIDNIRHITAEERSSWNNTDASKITSGVFDAARIPDLSASKITSGVLSANRIPNLSATKITSDTFSSDRIPDLDASKITSGVFDAERIPDLSASNITSGTLDSARLPYASSTSKGAVRISFSGGSLYIYTE